MACELVRNMIKHLDSVHVKAAIARATVISGDAVEITRGAKHPLVQRSADVEGIVEANADGDVSFAYLYGNKSFSERDFATALEVFPDRHRANEWVRLLDSDEQNSEPAEYFFKSLAGNDLLEACAQADLIEFPSGDSAEPIYLTRHGQYVSGTDAQFNEDSLIDRVLAGFATLETARKQIGK
jgi:hypothetical protein